MSKLYMLNPAFIDSFEEEDSFDSDLNNSESLTECEFTDSEGRPNPFHKHMEVPKIVIQAGSPGTAATKYYLTL